MTSGAQAKGRGAALFCCVRSPQGPAVLRQGLMRLSILGNGIVSRI
jgi:hypothetical protein